MRSQKTSQADLQLCLLSGSWSTQQTVPRYGLSIWLRALWWTMYLLSAFDAGQAHLAQEKLALVPRGVSALCSFPLPLRLAVARRDAARLRSWLHLLLNDRACYAESFALCAGLSVLGWECALVVGYASITITSATALHAWVEYEGEVVSDRQDISCGYLELERRRAGLPCSH